MKNNDLISRQAAIEAADAVWAVTGDKNVAKVWNQIKDLPSAQPEITEKQVKEYCEKRWLVVLTFDAFQRLKSAQPERNKGKWKVCGTFGDFLKCSCCGYKKPWNEDVFNFCPNCGAEMSEGNINGQTT